MQNFISAEPASPELIAELRQTLTALNAAVTILQEINSSVGDSQGLVSSRARRQVSTELNELLRDITGGHAITDDAGEPATERT